MAHTRISTSCASASGTLRLAGGTALEKHLVTLIPQPHDLCVIDLTQVDFG